MKERHLLSILVVIVAETILHTLATPTPLFVPFAIGAPSRDVAPPQYRPPQPQSAQPAHQLRPVSEVFYAITRSPHDPPPTFPPAGQAQSQRNEYFAQNPNQFVSSIEGPPADTLAPEGPKGGPLPKSHQADPPHEPDQVPVRVEHLQAVSGPPPMPSLPFHHTVPATLPNTPPFDWRGSIATTQVVPEAPSTMDALPSTVPLQPVESATTSISPPFVTDPVSGIGGAAVKEAPERHKSKSLPIVAIVLGTLGSIALLAFMLIDPRVSRACRSKRVKSKGLGKRPISSWFPFPMAHPHSSSRSVSRKAVGTRRGLELETAENSVHTSLATSCPRSKFSISSSDYSQMTRDSASTTDTVLVENTRANESIPPVRPPRPPTADSPATISDSVFFAAENRIYLEPSFALGGDLSMEQATGSSTMMMSEVGQYSGSPLLPPIGFFGQPSGSVSSTSTAVASPSAGVGGDASHVRQPDHGQPEFEASNSGLGSELESRTNDNTALYSSLGLFGSTSDTLSTREESRHSRTHSAPMFMGNPVHDSFQPIYMDPVARKVLQHRRSRSNSGWAYPRRPDANGSLLWSSDEESYHGVVGEAL